MPDCYIIPYTDKYGSHTMSKWANSAKEAKQLAFKARDGWYAQTVIGEPYLAEKQPFQDHHEQSTDHKDERG